MKLLILCPLLVLSACVYGPKTETKTPLSTLNGENYEASQLGGDRVLIPVVKTKERETHVQGRLMFSENGLQLPLRFVKLSLISSATDQSIQEVSTDSDGQFVFTGVFRNGDYTIRVISKKYAGEGTFTIKDYQVADVLIVAASLSR
jgi:hypothetical protein